MWVIFIKTDLWIFVNVKGVFMKNRRIIGLCLTYFDGCDIIRGVG